MAAWKNAMQLLSLLCCFLTVVQGQLNVASLPAVLFNGESQSIVEGSVIWLYCEVDSVSPSLRVTWNKDNIPLEQDVPHIRMRSLSTTSSSTFLLVVDNFQSSDDGTYQCTAEDGVMTGNGSTLTLTASTSSPGSLQIITNDAAITSGIPTDNRTGYKVGDIASLNFEIGHDITMYTAPTVLWLKDGIPTRATLTNTSNGRLSTTLSFSFNESDAGVYQCVFTGNNSELFVTIPIRLDTGENLTIESVSPTAIVLRPPEKLVLEVRATGRYNFINWKRNGVSFASGGAFQPQILKEFPHFFEIYVHEPTNTDDLGLYEVELVPSQGQQPINEVDIAVISPVDPNTTIVGSSVVTVVEGESVNISCISSGVPVPIITWKLNNLITSFSQTDVSTDFSVRLIRQGETLVPEFISGNIVSTLHIENTQYPAHNGVYECIGTDPDNTSVFSTAMITVQVEVIPEVDVTADVIRVAVGGNVTLTCTVTRGNPMIYTYTWTNVDTSITLLGKTSATLTLSFITEEEIATYRCDVNNSAGTGSDTITIEQAFPPVVSSRIDPPGPVVLGSTVDLVCEASIGDLPINFTWTDPNGMALNPTNTDRTISITLSSRDYGMYTCTATNAVGMNTAVVDVVLAVSPSVGLPSGSTASPEVVAGQTLTLSVSISDFNINLTSISWTKDGNSLTSGQARVTITNPILPATTAPVNSTLQLTSTLPSDSGSYVITSTNAAGSDNFTFSVSITDPVTITDPPNNTTVSRDEGDVVNFICTARGVPVPSITWSQVAGSRITIITTSPMADSEDYISITSTLTISDLMRDDNGSYVCNATNTIMGSVEMDTRTFTLTVNFTPSITVNPLNSTQLLSPASLSLNCTASGLPLPTITWIRTVSNGSETEFSMNSVVVDGRTFSISTITSVMMVESVFTINSTVVLDTANYTCHATNRLGSVNSSVTAVSVFGGPSIFSPMDSQQFEIHELTDFNFTCMAVGFPAPSLSFLHKGQPLGEVGTGEAEALPDGLEVGSEDVMNLNSEGLHVVTLTLTLFSVMDEDSGDFTCMASSNISGIGFISDSVTFELTVLVAANITDPPGDLTVTSPNHAIFYCSASGLPRPNITWFNPNSSLLMSGEDGVSISTLTMGEREIVSILNVTTTAPSNSGEYTCLADNGVIGQGDVNRTSAILTVHVTPEVTSVYPDLSQMNYTVNEGNTANFSCTATGIPPPSITWLRNGAELNSSDPRVTFNNLSSPVSVINNDGEMVYSVTRTFMLSMSRDEDSGIYECTASNEATPGMDTMQFELIVQIPPVVVPLTPSQRVVANVSESAVLSFRIDNAVPPVMTSDLRWYYTASAPSGVPNFNSTDFQEITNLVSRTSTSSLSYSDDMLNLTVNGIVQALMMGDETDAGRYFLRASNPAGEDSSFIDLVVYGPPQIVGGPQDQFSINNGSSAVFVCDAIADPPHNISWSFTNSSGSEISDIISTRDTNTANNKYTINRNLSFGELTVNNVTFEDRGTYKCTASNVVGEVSAAANLTVHVIPIIRGISQPNDTLLREPVAIFCLATGYPIPTFTWQKNGTSLDENSGDRINIFSLFPGISTKELEGSGSSGEGEEFESSGLRNGRECILNFLMMNTEINRNVITSLGELGIVGVLCFDDVIREDTDNYTCTISNELPQTTRITGTSNPVSLIVLEPPDPPINIISFNSGPRWIFIRWIPTFDGNRPVLNFIIQLRNINTSESSTVCNISVTSDSLISNGSSYMYNVSGDKILPFTQYRFRVVSCNVIGCGDQSDESDVRQTEEDTSSPPRNLTVTAITESTLTITWRIPQMPNGIITSYKVSFTGRKSYNASFIHSGVQNLTVNDVNSIRRATVVGLTPGTEYVLSVVAINGADRENGVGIPSTNAIGSTDNVPPPPPPPPPVNEPEPLSDNVRTYTLTLTEFGTVNGPISHYHVVVVILPQDQNLEDLQHPDILFPSITDLDIYSPELCDQNSQAPKAYITAEFGQNLYPRDKLFIVGANDDDDVNSPNDQSQYTNGVLCYSGRYTFFIRAYPESNLEGTSRRSVRQVSERQYNDFTSTQYYPTTTIDPAPTTSSSVGLIAGVVVGILLVISVAVIIVIIIIIRRRHSDIYKPDKPSTYQKNGYNESAIILTDYVPPDEGSDIRQPIPFPALAPHVERMHLNENCGFGEEYRIIQDKSPKKPVENCISVDNKPRNRYANIQCFDETRVMLKPVEGAEHDYINANFIEGYSRKKEYIASQGPLPDTIVDFWRMIWGYNVPTIVMLTNLTEKMKVKCSQYWPDSGSTQYNNIEVTLVNAVTHADYIIRQFHIKEVVSGQVKEVRQYHFTSWPDFGVPRHATPLLYFLQRIRNVHKYSDERPLIIHCSAGVGRTGSLITIDIELQRMEQHRCVDPFNTVLRLRQQRNFMVQTEAQYVFLHDAILEGASSGRTEIEVDQLNQKMKELEKVDEEDESGFKKEFNLLRQFKVNVKEFTDASDDANKFKNRLANALPYNYNRVHLQMSPGIGGSDYINASYIDGYTKKGTYIATQGPMSNTVEDFWRMIYEKKVSVIVMLSQLIEKGKEQCSQYWPSSKESPEKFGNYSLELLSENSYGDYLIREIKMTEQPSGNSHNVKQFHFLSWPENGVPTSGVGMVDLIDQVTRVQQHTGDKPIVVHCSAGIGRTGAFCSLSTAIERVKAEGIVDVFHTVKHLRTQRPHMVQNVDQYVFCYFAIREYVASLDNYSNFV